MSCDPYRPKMTINRRESLFLFLIKTIVIEKERAFLINQAMDSGKPEEIVRKMVDGRMYKFLKEATLLDQEFVVMPSDKVTVEQFADANNVNIKDFTRFSL